jgi:hypothetical protein
MAKLNSFMPGSTNNMELHISEMCAKIEADRSSNFGAGPQVKQAW